ncbi:MAG TPA: excinuclease ABC subunit C [Acidisarcina sp.]
MLAHSVPFNPREPAEALSELPLKPGVFALFAADPHAEPYLSRTTNLRRRISRFLDARPAAPGVNSRRLQLAERVVRIEYTAAGSDLESTLVLYSASLQAFGERARKRLRLAPPAFIRFAAHNPYPRAYVTNKLAKGAADHLYGPFPSRLAAERYLDEALNLFLLRRCTFELHPDPAFPGCVYSEMKMCLAPCFKGCTDERYAEEAARVQAFLATRGSSLLDALAVERAAASDAMEFEKAAAVHARVQKVQAVAALAAEVVRPLAHLRATLVMPAAEPFHVALFSLQSGLISGPALYSVAGMRHPNEQSGSSSLYAHPFALEPVPLIEAVPLSEAVRVQEGLSSLNGISSSEGLPGSEVQPTRDQPAGDGWVMAERRPVSEAASTKRASSARRGILEARLDEAFATLAAPRPPDSQQTTADHLCMFKRWYYRPAAQRTGEIIFHDQAAVPPTKAILRSISRVFRGASAPIQGAVVPLIS